MRRIGLHLRLETTLVNIIDRALKLNVDFFQCFLTLKTAGRIVPLNSSDIDEFIKLRRQYFKELYLHVSYWVNLSTVKYNPHKLLQKELALAKKMELTHVIMHAGSCRGARKKSDGIDALARMMNALMKKEPDLTFVLENVAQKYPSIGGDINHFGLFLEKLDNPDKICFCIDTAHAFSYGYDISDDNKQDEFINLLEEKIGIDKICLIHLNDNREDLGSHVDRHQALGEGQIGAQALKRFILHPKLKDISVLSEPPDMSQDGLELELKKIIDWHK